MCPSQFHQIGQLPVRELRERGLAGAQHRVGQLPLAGEHVGDTVLDGSLRDHPVHLYGPGLPDAVRAVGGLRLDGGIPPAVVVHDVLGPCQVQARARGLQRQQEDGDFAVLEAAHHRFPFADGRPAVQELRADAPGSQMPFDDARHAHVLREDQNARTLGEDGAEQFVQQLQLP